MKLRSLILLATFLFGSGLLRAQWIQTNGPDGGGVYDFAERNGNLYAATFSGVYASTDQGESWTFSGLQGIDFYRIHTANNLLFAAAYDSLYRSTDNGTTWAKVWDSPGIRIQTITSMGNDLFLSVFSSDTLAGGVYYSSDKGTNWVKRTFDSRFTYIRGLVVSGNYLVAMSRVGNIFRTTDKGITWMQVTVPSPFGVSIAKVIGTRIIAAGTHGIHYSTDQGATWVSPPNVGIDEYDLLYDFGIQGNTVVATSFYTDSVFRSTNLGQSWTPLPEMFKANPIYRMEAIGGKLFCGSWMGLLASTDAGVTWNPSFKGMHTSVAEVAVYQNELFASTGYGIFHSTDDGVTWGAPSSAALPYSVTGKFLTIDGNFYVLNQDGMYRWNGTSWNLASTNSIGEIVSNGDTWYGSVDGDIQVSTDQGQTWAPKNSGLPPASGGNFVGPNIFYHNGILLARISTLDNQSGTRSDMIYRSSNGGDDWQMVYVDTNYTDVVDFGVFGGVLFASTYGNGLQRSSDNGLTWQRDNNVSADVVTDIFAFNNVLYISTDNSLLISDNGSTWRSVATPFGYSIQMAANGTTMYAGVGFDGIWKHPLNTLEVPNTHSRVNNDLAVTPNPFEDHITVSFTLEEQTEISLLLQDIQGHTLRILYEGDLTPSQHTIAIDHMDVPPGFYTLLLQTGQGKTSIKALRIR